MSEKGEDDVPLCPNFVGSDDAPTTANCGEEKKVFSDFSMIFVIIWGFVKVKRSELGEGGFVWRSLINNRHVVRY